jgi:hypothetical protein
MRINSLIILAIVGIVWGCIGYGFDVVVGRHWLSLIPCAGLVVLIWYSSRFMAFIISVELKESGTIRKLANVIGNLGLMLLELNKQNPTRHEQLIQLLMLEPAEFKARMGIRSAD